MGRGARKEARAEGIAARGASSDIAEILAGEVLREDEGAGDAAGGRRNGFVLRSEQDILDAVDRGLLFDRLRPQDYSAVPYRSEITFIAASARLQAPSASGGKGYRGWIGVRPARQGGLEFIGAVTYGPLNAPDAQMKVYCHGRSLKETIDVVNKRLERKQSASARSIYSPIPGTGPAYLDGHEVYRQVEELLRPS